MPGKRKFWFAFLLVLVALALVAGSMVRRGFSAREEPSAVEAMMAQTMRSLAVPSGARDLKNPVPLTPEALQEGLEHFADHCAVCHANNGSGDTPFGRQMYPKPPDMRTALTQDKSDGELYYTIQNGVRLTGMPAFGQPGRTDDHSTWKLVLFIRNLPELSAEQEEQMRRLNPKSNQEWLEMIEMDNFLTGGEAEAKRASGIHTH